MNTSNQPKVRVGLNKIAVACTCIVLFIVGLHVYNYVNDTPEVRQARVRSLASIMASGGTLPREYSGISLSAGDTVFADEQERAKYEGYIFDGGEGTLAQMKDAFGKRGMFGYGEIPGLDGKGGSYNGRGGGAAGAGADAASKAAAEAMAALNKATNGAVNGQDAAALLARANGRNGFQTADIARANGQGLSGSFGGSAYRGGQSATGADSIDGVMPDGNTLLNVDARLLGAHSAKYTPSLESRTHSGGTGGNSEGFLRGIAVQSGKVAANKNRAANEGATPFLMQQALAGELDVEGNQIDESLMGVGDDSFGDKMDFNLGNLGGSLNKLQKKEDERFLRQTNLVKGIVALTIATIAAMAAISLLKAVEPYGPAMIGVILGAMLIAFGLFGWEISKYVDFCDGKMDGWSWGMSGGIALLLAGLIATCASSAVSSFISKIVGGVSKFFGVKDVTAALAKPILLGGISAAGTVGAAGNGVTTQGTSTEK